LAAVKATCGDDGGAIKKKDEDEEGEEGEGRCCEPSGEDGKCLRPRSAAALKINAVSDLRRVSENCSSVLPINFASRA
jgi:hypothetical protein